MLLGGGFSCAVSSDSMNNAKLIEVWTKDGWPPSEMQATEGFKISPNDAYQIIARSKKLSLKHDWICYRDQRYYYIADAFGQSSSAKTALKLGVKVNGSTGEIE